MRSKEPSTARDIADVCLCIIFNHPYLDNLPLLRKIYSGRFRYIRFLVPLVKLADPDVITVYRGSFSHNAYAVDAWPQLEGINCSHFLFTHDDVLLAPALNDENILETLGVGAGAEGFMPTIQPMPSDVRVWGHFAGPLWRFTQPRNFLSGTGVDSLSTVLAQLPPAESIRNKFSVFGAPENTIVKFGPVTSETDNHLGMFSYFGERTKEQNDAFRESYLRMLFDAPDGQGSIVIPYPLLVSGPSGDFYMVPRSAMPDFVHISGVLAAAGMFVEVAAPTALVLACDRVRTCRETALDFVWSSTWMQPEAVVDQMALDHRLIAVHPVKLSMVKDADIFLGELHAMRECPLGAKAAVRALAADFDPDDYLEANPDVKAAAVSPWLHYIHHGHEEGRRLRPPPS